MRTLCFSDIHGNRQLFDQVMAFLKPDDKIFFLGDAIDRGPDGWAIFKQLMDDSRITFICGNHEDMMVNALRTFPKIKWNEDMEVWSWNGNEPTLNAIQEDNPELVKQYLIRACSLPIFQTYTNEYGDIFWLSHAGCNYVENLADLDTHDLIWDRSHFIPNKWDINNPNNVYIVHGHTPIPYLVKELAMFDENVSKKFEPGAYYYAGGNKICIDCGAHFTNTTVLLNLDTFDEEIFTLDGIA